MQFDEISLVTGYNPILVKVRGDYNILKSKDLIICVDLDSAQSSYRDCTRRYQWELHYIILSRALKQKCANKCGRPYAERGWTRSHTDESRHEQ